MTPVGPLFTLGRKVQVEFHHACTRYRQKNNTRMHRFISAESTDFNDWAASVYLFEENNPKALDNYLARQKEGERNIKLFEMVLDLLMRQLERLNELEAKDIKGRTEPVLVAIRERIVELAESIVTQGEDLIKYSEKLFEE